MNILYIVKIYIPLSLNHAVIEQWVLEMQSCNNYYKYIFKIKRTT